jgi:hypothetical protein
LRAAVSDLDPSVHIEVEKVMDVNYATEMGIFITPDLVVHGRVTSVSKVLNEHPASPVNPNDPRIKRRSQWQSRS